MRASSGRTDAASEEVADTAPVVNRSNPAGAPEVVMNRGHRLPILRLTLVTLAVLVAFSGPLTGSAFAKDKTEIQLRLRIERTGRPTIIVNPPEARIWRSKPDKPKKVEWYTVNNTPYTDIFWELRYEPSKGGGTANYFGDVDLECGVTRKKVQPDKKPDFPNAQWPYKVSVYACVDGVKGQELATVDPRIVWKD
jgi:hypothetical protein